MYSIMEKLDWYRRRERFSKNRPKCNLKDATSENKKELARKWWNWAIDIHYEPIKKYHQRKSKDFIIQRAKEINTYKRFDSF